MFGKASFNRTQFNKGSETAYLYASVRVNFETNEPRLAALVDLGEQSIRSQFDVYNPALSFRVPIGSVDCKSVFTVTAELYALVNLQPTNINVVFDFDATSLRTEGAEEFSLNDIGLLPGEVLIIDTDQLDIQVNGVADVESWVSGGVFFQLKPGGDIIQVFTNPDGVQLEVSVQWSDRYL